MKTLRLLSYNIHKGVMGLRRQPVLKGIRESIRAAKADVVFLQEVQGGAEDVSPSQLEYLADSVWTHHAYGRNAVYPEGHHGNAILSRFPIRDWENIDVSASRLESRGLLHAAIEPPGSKGPLHLVCLHLGLIEAWRRRQREQLIRFVRATVPEGEPVVVAGDFNDWTRRASKPLREALGLREAHSELHRRYARTYPARQPLLDLDRIYLGGLLTPTRAEALTGPPWDRLSDHLALLVEVTLPA